MQIVSFFCVPSRANKIRIIVRRIWLSNNRLPELSLAGIKELYGADVTASQVQLQKTKKEFKGHLTLVVIPIPSHVEEISGADRSGNR